jgi:hypothetical protein
MAAGVAAGVAAGMAADDLEVWAGALGVQAGAEMG